MKATVGIQVHGPDRAHSLIVEGWASTDEGFEIRSIAVEAYGRRRDITPRFNALRPSDRWEFRQMAFDQWVEEKRADYMTGDPRF